MTNEQLALSIQAGGSSGERMEELYSQVKAFIHMLAWKYRAASDVEDLEQEGFLALYDAVRGYQPGKGAFLSYAAYWIEARIRRFIQNDSCLHIPAGRQGQRRKLQQFQEEYEKEYGQTPPAALSCSLLNLTLKEYQERKKTALMGQCLSLDAPITDQEGEGLTLGDTVAASGSLEEDIIGQIDCQELKRLLWGMVNSLPGMQPAIIRARYQEGKSMREIAAEQGSSPEAVRGQQAVALRTLRNPKNLNRLRCYLENSEIYSLSITATGAERFRQTWTSSTERAALVRIEREEKKGWRY